jgi:hypothetical protein
MKQLAIIILFAALLQGCATSYIANGFSGGYSETQLDENVFKVTFRGNGYTRRERAADFTLLRSAELTLEHGYQYFMLVNANSSTSQSSYTTPTVSNTTASVYGSGNYAYGNASTTTYGGQTYNISKPSSSNTIVCFKKNPNQVLAIMPISYSKVCLINMELSKKMYTEHITKAYCIDYCGVGMVFRSYLATKPPQMLGVMYI